MASVPLLSAKPTGNAISTGQALKLRGLNRMKHSPTSARGREKLRGRRGHVLKYDLVVIRSGPRIYYVADFFDRCDEIGLLILEEIPGWNYLGNAT